MMLSHRWIGSAKVACSRQRVHNLLAHCKLRGQETPTCQPIQKLAASQHWEALSLPRVLNSELTFVQDGHFCLQHLHPWSVRCGVPLEFFAWSDASAEWSPQNISRARPLDSQVTLHLVSALATAPDTSERELGYATIRHLFGLSEFAITSKRTSLTR